MKLELPAGDFEAYLFDCDGTVADSMPLHYLAWKQALDEQGCEFPKGLFYQWGGVPIRDIIRMLNKRHGLHMDVASVARREESLYYSYLPRLKAVPEVLDVILAAYGKLPLAVVSGSTRESVTASLKALRLLDKFDALVCAGDYTRSKPDPEGYLLAAHKLGVRPERCVVFEDTGMGIEAATSAGMASVKVLQPWERAQNG